MVEHPATLVPKLRITEAKHSNGAQLARHCHNQVFQRAIRHVRLTTMRLYNLIHCIFEAPMPVIRRCFSSCGPAVDAILIRKWQESHCLIYAKKGNSTADVV
jgi:hypothetical protein